MDKVIDSVYDAAYDYKDDDFADKLSSRYTVLLLAIFSIFIGTVEYIGNPISCWSPVHFKKSHIDFTTNYCWVKNTYYIPWDKPVPQHENEMRQVVPYYQWVFLILLAQAVLFYLPKIIWQSWNSKAGVDTNSIILAARTFSRTDREENRDRTLKMLINQMDRFLISRRHPNQHRCCRRSCRCEVCGRRLGNYLLILYLTTKVLYIANVICQLFLLNVVLAAKYSTFGFDIARDMFSNVDWTEESYVAFPRVTLCDFKVRGQDMVNVHPYTVQCVLTINIYNELIYIILWYWMVFVAIISVISFLVWFTRSVLACDRLRFVRNHLRRSIRNKYAGWGGNGATPGGRSQRYDDPEREKLWALHDNSHTERFVTTYLRVDGVFLLRLITHNTNGITTTEVTRELWELWYERQPKEDKQLPLSSQTHEYSFD